MRPAASRASMSLKSCSIPSPLSADTSTGRCSGRLPFGEVVHALAAGGVEAIDLVPDFDDAPAVAQFDAELAQHVLDIMRLRLGIFVRHVAHVQDHVGLDHLFERGAERRHQHGRQVGDEADGVGQDDAQSLRQIDRAQRRIERGKQHVGRQHARLRHAIEQRRLAGVGVADQRDDRIRHALAAVAMQLARALDLLEFVLDARDAVPRSAAGRSRTGSRPVRRGSRSRRAGVQDGSRSAPAGSSDRSDARARPAARPRACARAGRRFPGSARCGRPPWRPRPFPDCAAAPATAGSPSRRSRSRRF